MSGVYFTKLIFYKKTKQQQITRGVWCVVCGALDLLFCDLTSLHEEVGDKGIIRKRIMSKGFMSKTTVGLPVDYDRRERVEVYQTTTHRDRDPNALLPPERWPSGQSVVEGTVHELEHQTFLRAVHGACDETAYVRMFRR